MKNRSLCVELTSRAFNGRTRTATAMCSCDVSFMLADALAHSAVIEKIAFLFKNRNPKSGGNREFHLQYAYSSF